MSVQDKRGPAPRTHLLTAAVICIASLSCTAPALGFSSGFGDQWALSNTGQFSGTPDDDIDIAQAWELERGGNPAVLVGLVDSGVGFAHASFAHTNLYTQTTSAPQGCGEALYGCSFLGSGGTPTDEAGHGTATAGEIAAGWEDGPYAGVAPASTLIAAKVLDSSAKGSAAAEVAGLEYVADHGARVVNVSIVGDQSLALHDAITDHPRTLFVAAAGNAGADDDTGSAARYPCADPAPNVICVAASDPKDQLASFSNYGHVSVDLAAPGADIATLTLEGYSDDFNGTSFAAPLVSGTAALAFALRPNASVAQVKKAILDSVDARPALSGKTVTGGRLNAYRTLLDLSAMLPTAPPGSTVAPVLSAERIVGQTITATDGDWSGQPTSTSIAWERCNSNGGLCQLIAGATGAEHQLTAADSGHDLRAQVTATNSAGAEIAFSAPVAILATAPAPSSAQPLATGRTPGSPTGQQAAPAVAVATLATGKHGAAALHARVKLGRGGLVSLLLSSTASQRISVILSYDYRGQAKHVQRLTIAGDGQRSVSLRPSAGNHPRTLLVEIHTSGVSLKRLLRLP